MTHPGKPVLPEPNRTIGLDRDRVGLAWEEGNVNSVTAPNEVPASFASLAGEVEQVVELVEVVEVVPVPDVFIGGMRAKKLTAPPITISATTITTTFLGEKARHRDVRRLPGLLIRVLPTWASVCYGVFWIVMLRTSAFVGSVGGHVSPPLDCTTKRPGGCLWRSLR